jgi:hypothetical protein
VLSRIRLGILAHYLPATLLDEALAATDRDEQRFRALPSRLGIYFVLASCLLRTTSSTAVIKKMIPPDLLARLSPLGWRLPCSTALTKLRDRIGAAPLQLLFGAVAQPAPTRVRPWSHAFGLLVVAWDGTEIDVADTTDNRDRFRRHRGRDGVAVGTPKARLLVLLACGSRRLIGAVTGTLSHGETTLARQLVGRLREGMLLLADRNFLGHPLWTAARASGAHLLWRAKNTTPQLCPQQWLTDQSYLARLHDPADIRLWRRNIARNRKRGHKPPRPRPIRGITVRVVEALITVTLDGVTRTEHYRLVTSLLDPDLAPAEQLVALYARRWAAETGIREIKTTLLAGRALRGATPVRALQELWATLVIYQTIRLLICQAALTQDLDPSRISFTAALDTAQHMITTTPAHAPDHLAQACDDLCRHLITRHVHARVFPRALKNTLSRYPYRGKTQQLTCTKASYQVHIAPHTTPGSTATDPFPTTQPRAA